MRPRLFEWLSRASRRLQTRAVALFLLIIAATSQVTGAVLLRSVRNYYLNGQRESLATQARLLSTYLAPEMTAPEPDREAVARLAAEFNRQLGISFAVIDRTGRVMYASDAPELIGARLARSEITQALGGQVAEAVRSESGIGSGPGRPGDQSRRRLYLAYPIGSTLRPAGVAYVAASLQQTERVIADIRSLLLTSLAIALLLAGIMAWVLGRAITGPIGELTEQAQRLAQGVFQPIPVRGDDEIGRLAEMFNQMQARLERTLGQMAAERDRFESVVARLEDGVLAIDAAGSVSLLNPAAARILGVGQVQAVGRHWREVLGATPASFEADLERLLTGADVDLRSEFERGDRILRLRGAAMEMAVGDDGRPHGPATADGHEGAAAGGPAGRPGALLVIRDVTADERAEQLRRQFLADVSHELRTPLTTMKSYLETAMDPTLEDAELRRQFLTTAVRETDRMTRLVRDLLRLAELDAAATEQRRGGAPGGGGGRGVRRRSGRRPLEVGRAGWVAVAPLVDEVCSAFRLPLGQKSVELQVTLDEGLPDVRGDRDQLLQVLHNLVGNAVEFTPPGGRIEITVRPVGADRVEWTVADTGVGIPREDVPRVFDRFYRVDKGRSRRLGGTGLGLAIARQIVEQHGGEISLESEVGRGTTVRFTLLAQGRSADPHAGGWGSEAERDEREGARPAKGPARRGRTT